MSVNPSGDNEIPALQKDKTTNFIEIIKMNVVQNKCCTSCVVVIMNFKKMMTKPQT